MKNVHFTLVAPLLLAGCAKPPSVPIFGAFFPGWLLCIIGAILVTLIIRAVITALGLGRSVGPLVVTYPLLVIILTFVAWIIFFKN